MRAATPTFSPVAGTYSSAQSVTISSSTSGATIRYTTDGSTPSETSGTVYSSSVAVNSTETIKAIAYESGLIDSSVATAAYTIETQVAQPAFSPTGGTYNSTQTVTISTTTSGATIAYTLDGSTPSETHGTPYAGAITVSSTETIKAIAYESGMTDSSVASATYTINSGGGTPWYSNSWAYRKTITVNSAQVPSTQTNFPMLVSLPSDADLAAHALSNGYDIVFTDSSGTSVLNYERELFNPSTGQLIAWVNVPSLSNGAVIYVYFGNSSETTDQQNSSGTCRM